MKLWGGRFTKDTDQLVDKFNASISFDKNLAEYDIAGSIAHAQMLAKQGIITEEEGKQILVGLELILKEIREGKFVYTDSLEDIHLHVESRLKELIGPVGGKLHTARSRNDQVALDMHLYVKDQIKQICQLLKEVQKSLISLARANQDVIMPGYTHLQHAQPVLFAHHLLAYFSMFQRDRERLEDCYKRTDMLPLGAGALAGTTFPIDPQFVAEKLGFKNLYSNSMDAVSDRDYLVEFLAALSLIMVHLSRLSEEIILWTSWEFGFIEIGDEFCTGSSIMPQKKNPDVAELTRGKTGRVIGSLMGLLTILKGLPLAYNKDLQEDKEGVFDAVETVKICLAVYGKMLTKISVKRERMLDACRHSYTNATDVADYLVKKGMPFRDAHYITGQLVQYCISKNCALDDLSLGEFRKISPLFEEDVLAEIAIESCVAKRLSPGGTGHAVVELALKEAEQKLALY
ncbi:MAG TPA: argininosuccinate lyase [Clostridia bacterium]|nr:argininosuccinate lyase [Clostridia bacterium]